MYIQHQPEASKQLGFDKTNIILYALPSFNQASGVGAEAKVWSFIFIMIIESGMVSFAIQLIRIVLTVLELDAFKIIVGINEMFNVIIRSVISTFHRSAEIISREYHPPSSFCKW